MRLRHILLATGVLTAVCLLLLTWNGQRLENAEQRHRQRRQALDQLHRQLETLQRGGPGSVTGDTEPLALARQAVAAASLPVNSLRGIRPQGQRPLGDGGLTRHSIAIQLQDLAMADLGKWLASWHHAQNPWRIDEIACSHQRGDEDRLLVLITCHADLPEGTR